MRPRGAAFQEKAWQAITTIPFEGTASCRDLAEKIGLLEAVRAVGAAVGPNPISILIPCHRVIGKDGSLTGYAGGLDRKKALLHLEGFRQLRENWRPLFVIGVTNSALPFSLLAFATLSLTAGSQLWAAAVLILPDLWWLPERGPGPAALGQRGLSVRRLYGVCRYPLFQVDRKRRTHHRRGTLTRDTLQHARVPFKFGFLLQLDKIEL